jgi:hypothetical protein
MMHIVDTEHDVRWMYLARSLLNARAIYELLCDAYTCNS